MPKNKEALIRYRVIDGCLRERRHAYPSMEWLISVLEEKLGKTFTVSTIQKDLKAMREDEALGYLAPIVFSRHHGGYYYSDPLYTIASVPLNEEDIDAMEFATVILEQFRSVPIMRQYGHAVDKIMEAVHIGKHLGSYEEATFIQFEHIASPAGSAWLGPLVQAVKARRVIRFSYQRYDSEEVKSHRIHPYLLRQSRGRWYLVGMHDRRRELVTYALDRISELAVSEDPVEWHPEFEPAEFFRHAIGVMKTAEAPAGIIIEATPLQGKYFKSLPLHESQEILIDSPQAFRMKITVHPSLELKMQLLSFGPAVRVLEPGWFVEEFREMVARTMDRYADPAVGAAKQKRKKRP